MPLIQQSNYHPPFPFKNGHLNTIYPSLFRKVKGIDYQRERITTPDGDFFDIDWLQQGNRKLVVLCHGLEGSSEGSYIKGMARVFLREHWDAVAMNFRGCSGEPNRLLKAYHSGFTEDLETLIVHVLNEYDYEQIALVGFSLGGNLVLKYLGEQGVNTPAAIQKAVAISVPCDLEKGAAHLSRPSNWFYLKRFLIKLTKKVEDKVNAGHDIDFTPFKKAKSFKDFDGLFTAPVHGFSSAEDYWRKCSSKHFLKDIQIPTLILNALDDPFLPKECYPFDFCKNSHFVHLETPQYGGHVGFTLLSEDKAHWSENRTVEFVENII